MSLADDKQQNIQMQLDFSCALTGEARKAGREETESSRATSGSESPARTDRLMEEVCERENLKEALRQVKANKGSPVGQPTEARNWRTASETARRCLHESSPVSRNGRCSVPGADRKPRPRGPLPARSGRACDGGLPSPNARKRLSNSTVTGPRRMPTIRGSSIPGK